MCRFIKVLRRREKKENNVKRWNIISALDDLYGKKKVSYGTIVKE